MMNFYRRRPLALAVSVGMLFCALSTVLPGWARLVLAGLAILLAYALRVLLSRLYVGEVCGMRTKAFLLFASLLTAALLLRAFFVFDIRIAPFQENTNGVIEATVLRSVSSASYYETYEVQLRSLDNEKSGVRGLVQTETMTGMVRGDTFTAKVKFIPLEEFYGIYEVTRGQMAARGYDFTCEIIEEGQYTGKTETLAVRLAALRSQLAIRMSLYLDRVSAALAKALLFADKSSLGIIERNFRYAGVSHLLAVSGLHLHLLCGMLQHMLRRLFVGRIPRNIVLILFVIGYSALVGFPVTVVRAGIMMILSCTAAIILRDYDSLSALFFSAGVILLCDPASIYDSGFMLSFTATLGVILFAGDAVRFTKQRFPERKHKNLRSFLSVTYASLGAVMFTLPLQWLYFGEISLLSIPSTLVLMIFCEGMLMLTPWLVLCAMLGLHFLCGRIAWLVMLLSHAIEVLADFLAGFSPLISIDYPFVPVIIALFVGTLVYMIIRDRERWVHVLIPYCACCVLFFVCLQIWNFRHADTTVVSYIPDGTNDAFILVSQGENLVVDVSTGSRRTMNRVAHALADCRETEVDTLLLTHIHRRHINAVRALLNARIVHTIVVPEAENKDEEYLLLDLADAVQPYGVKLITYSRKTETRITVGIASVDLPKYALLSRSVHPLVALRFSARDAAVYYGCGSFWENEKITEFLDGTATLIIGRHGPLYKTDPVFAGGERTLLAAEDNPAADVFGVSRMAAKVSSFVLVP